MIIRISTVAILSLRAAAAVYAPRSSLLHASPSCELRKLCAQVEEGADFLAITPPRVWQPASIDTYDDHRMAMCFSLAALGGVALRIHDPACVGKTFPGYFAALASITGAKGSA